MRSVSLSVGILFAAYFAGIASTRALANEVCGGGADRALVLSGGGTKGAFEAAAAYHLIVHRGCDFKDLSGVSAGALNVSFLSQAPMGAESLANLQKQATTLVNVWRGITSPDAFMTPRWLGAIRMAVFGLEGLNDFAPLRDLMKTNIKVDAIRKSGRKVRVGYTSFYDGRYHELGPESKCLHPDNPDQFLDYVFASALIPVFGDMPVIRKAGDISDPTTWTQFADGGVRHTTPVPGYFPTSGVLLQYQATSIQEWTSICDEPGVPPHEGPISDLFLIIAGPFNPADDRTSDLKCGNSHCKQNHDGREIAMRSVWSVLESPYRWDVNYARIANNMLKWRQAVRTKFPNVELKSVAEFPVFSYNNVDPEEPLPYRMALISPSAELTTEVYEVTEETMRRQLSEGCKAANEAVVESLGGKSMSAECDRAFPPPPKHIR